MEFLLKHSADEPVDFTYLGIGSCPHISKGESLAIKQDQLIPVCLREKVFHENKQTRIIHMDPLFDQYKEFLHSYFEEFHLVPIDMEGGMRWIGETVEVIILSERIDHKDQYWFFESLCDTILNTKGTLVIQEYTGYELHGLNHKLLKSCPQKEKFKRRILLDMTFGTDTGCCTDMTKAMPYYDSNGEFLNIHFLSDEDVKRWIGISSTLDTLLQTKYRSKYLQTLNSMHVDYRRKLKGDTVMYGSPEYSNESSPEEIMSVLQKNLRNFIKILLAVKMLDTEKQNQVDMLFTQYKNYDPYKWYDAVYKIVQL